MKMSVMKGEAARFIKDVVSKLEAYSCGEQFNICLGIFFIYSNATPSPRYLPVAGVPQRVPTLPIHFYLPKEPFWQITP